MRLTDKREKLISAAAKWWSDKLRTHVVFDNGDAMCNAVAALFGPKDTLPPGDSDALEKAINEIGREKVAACKDGDNFCRLRLEVDYDPWYDLGDACERAGIANKVKYYLPCKTRMAIDLIACTGTVSEGYGAQPKPFGI